MSEKRNVTYGFILLIVCYFLSSVFKLGANIVIPVYAQKFHFSSAVNGLLSSSYFLSYAFMQLLSGPLCKKYSSTKVVGLSMTVTCLGCLCFAFAKSAVWVFVARLFTGIGMGTIFVGVIEYETENFRGKSFERAASFAFAATSIGSICSAAPLNFLINSVGISLTFVILGLVVFAIVVMLLLFSRDAGSRETEQITIVHQVGHAIRVINASKYLLCGTGLWLTYIAVQMSYSGMWCTSWALEAFKSKSSLAPVNGSACGIALMFGSLFSSMIHKSGRTSSQACSFAGWMVSVSFAFVILFHELGLFWCAFPFILVFGFMAGHLCVQLIAMCRENTSVQDNATVTGYWNALASISVLFAQWSSGILIGKIGYTFSISVYLVIHLIMTIVYCSVCKKEKV